jgi:ABC-2 type transport system ATP-binding protein
MKQIRSRHNSGHLGAGRTNSNSITSHTKETDMNNTVVHTTGLTRHFHAVTAVEGLELTVPRGSVYAFLGPNGAGKTTTIRLLLGLIRPDGGAVDLFGTPLRRNRIALLRRVGAMVEWPSLYPHLTGRENLEVTRRMIGGKRERIDEVLRIVHMEDSARRCVKGYSTGMKQRLGLALALLGEPELLILDEPTNGLDPAGIREMREFICSLPREHGITVFLSSHMLNEVEHVATHIGIIHKGKLLFQGTQDELQAQLTERARIRVDRTDHAARILAQTGWSIQRNGQNELYAKINGPSDAALLNRKLVEAGLSVSELSLSRPSLEDVFLAVTSEEVE